ncbi:MAG: phenylalanine--tRNA ligase beta subunit-related protein [Candidatus Bathyarchaeota archaeon]
MTLKIEKQLRNNFPDINVNLIQINDVKIKNIDDQLEKNKGKIIKNVRRKYEINSLKDQPTIKTYRDFFWKIGIDPTKIRPAAEALIRRIVAGKPIPKINTLVDAYNLASIETRIAFAAFDTNELDGDLLMRFAEKGEQFYGIGMKKSYILKGGEIVISDNKKLIAIYPYRDAENTKVTEKTKNVTLIACGVPGISNELLLNATQTACSYILNFCDGIKEK